MLTTTEEKKMSIKKMPKNKSRSQKTIFKYCKSTIKKKNKR